MERALGRGAEFASVRNGRRSRCRPVKPFVALVAVLLLRQWYVNGTIPFLTRTFTVAPAAATATPGSTTAAPSVEPRTNASFRIAR
jgi:hypothetical protein